MLGVEFEKIKNVTFLIYNEGTFFSKKDLQLHSSFKQFKEGLASYDWSYITECTDVQTAYDLFWKNLSYFFDIYFPLV